MCDQVLTVRMARPLRLEFGGALYHLTARGNVGQAIFVDDDDRLCPLEVLSGVVDRFARICHAYRLMTIHYHLLVETPAGTLSRTNLSLLAGRH